MLNSSLNTAIGKFHRPLQALVVLILLATGFFAYQNWIGVQRRLALGVSARRQLVGTIEFISRLKDAETSQRGYLLTGSEDYLAPYKAAISDLPLLMNRLAEVLGNDPALNADFKLLRTLTEQKLSELALTIRLRREQGLDTATQVVRTDAGKRTMDSIRALVEKMTAREMLLLQAGREGVTRTASQGFWLTWLGLACLFLSIVGLEWAVAKEVRLRGRLADSLDKAHVIITKLDGEIVYWNSSDEAVYGWTREQAVGKKTHELLRSDLPEPYEEMEAELFRACRWSGEIKAYRRDGSALWVSAHWVLQHDAAGRPASIVKMYNEITELKHASAALQASESTVRSLFESASQGIVLVDALGKIVDSNATMEGLFGYSLSEMLGAPVEMLVPESLRAGHIGHRDAGSSSARPMGVGMDLVGRRKDGTEFPVEVSLSSIQQQDGIQTVAFFSDITLRKQQEQVREDLIGRLEKALAEAREMREVARVEVERFAHIVAASPGAICKTALHEDGKLSMPFATAGFEDLFDLDPLDLVEDATPLLVRIHPEDIDEVMTLTAESARSMSALRLEYRIQHRARGEVWIAVNAMPVQGPKGTAGWYWIAMDATERKQAELAQVLRDRLAKEVREHLISQLEVALEERSVLLKEVHHRVKNNLAVIVGLLGMQSSSMGDERLTAALEESQQRVASMALIHEFLYAGDNMGHINFGEYVRHLTAEVCESYSVGFDPSCVSVETEAIDLPVHRAIPCGLILNELLSNALKYAFSDRRAGKLTVRFVRLENGQLSLSCLDDGIGIQEDFDWRNSPSMGLKIAQILAKQLKGDLTLDRSSGTMFELRFSEHSTHVAAAGARPS